MSYSQAWLESTSSIKGLFIEVTVSKSTDGGTNWSTETLYLSSVGYVTSDASVAFNPVINNKVKFNEVLSERGASISYGDIELLNPNGELDDYLDATKYLWANKVVNMYLGDPFWVSSNITDFKTKFKLIFNGVIKDIDSKKKNVLNIKFVDKLQRLNYPISENKLGTYGNWTEDQSNKDAIRPIIFGEVHNITPLYVDPSQLQYMFCERTTTSTVTPTETNAERITEVRDNAVPIYTDKDDPGVDVTTGIIYTAPNGTFKLVYAPAGSITMSAQGVQQKVNLNTGAVENTYSNNIAEIIALIVVRYGNPYQRFSASDLDLTNLLAFSTANTQPIGVYVSGSETVLSVCSEIANSIGASLFISRVGKLQLLRYGVPFVNSNITSITADDMILNSFSLKDRLEVRASCTIGYCKNWTVQQDLLTAIPAQHKENYNREYFTKTATDATGVKTRYGLTTEPETINTLLVSGTDAAAEADRLMQFYRTQRNVYSMTGTTKLFGLELGQQITLYHSRFGLHNGKTGQVVALAPNWIAGTIDVEVLI